MSEKNVTFEELENLKAGDQIIIDDPIKQINKNETTHAYAFIDRGADGHYHFISDFGATFMINSQKTIDGFNVRLIDKNHSAWNEDLSKSAKVMNHVIYNLEDSLTKCITDLFGDL